MSIFFNVADFVQKLIVSIPGTKWCDKKNLFLEALKALNKTQCFSMYSKIAQNGFNRHPDAWNVGILS